MNSIVLEVSDKWMKSVERRTACRYNWYGTLVLVGVGHSDDTAVHYHALNTFIDYIFK